jgi:transposase
MAFTAGTRKRKDVTLQQKIAVLDELKQGKKRKDIAAQLGVGVSTIGDWMKDEEKLRQIQISNGNIQCKRQRIS